MDEEPGRTTQWLRGVIDLVVLALLLKHGPSYGYLLLQELEKAGLELKGGTLYPVLARLEADALVSTEWSAGASGPGRKWFTITPLGRAALARNAQGWTDFTGRIAAILSADTHRGAKP